MFFHTLAWFLHRPLRLQTPSGTASLIVTGFLFLLASSPAFVAYRLFKKGAPPTPDLAIEEAKLIRDQFEAQSVERDAAGEEQELMAGSQQPRGDPRLDRGDAPRAGLLGQRPALEDGRADRLAPPARENRNAALVGAAVAGFVIGGGVAATFSLFSRRRRR